jgi:hypothetical protein
MNNNDNNNETMNHDEMALLSCAIKYERTEQMVKMFCTHRCAFNFDWKFCVAHVNKNQDQSQEAGVLGTSSIIVISIVLCPTADCRV